MNLGGVVSHAGSGSGAKQVSKKGTISVFVFHLPYTTNALIVIK